MEKLHDLPSGFEEIVAVYGNPGGVRRGRCRQQWWKKAIVMATLPFPMRASWDRSIIIRRQPFHRLVAPAALDALEAIAAQVPPEYLRVCDLDVTGGVYCHRPKRGARQSQLGAKGELRGGAELSTHAWGIAIDICPHLGPMGGPDLIPAFITEAFTARGFHQLEHDTMHFQACRAY